MRPLPGALALAVAVPAEQYKFFPRHLLLVRQKRLWSGPAALAAHHRRPTQRTERPAAMALSHRSAALFPQGRAPVEPAAVQSTVAVTQAYRAARYRLKALPGPQRGLGTRPEGALRQQPHPSFQLPVEVEVAQPPQVPRQHRAVAEDFCALQRPVFQERFTPTSLAELPALPAAPAETALRRIFSTAGSELAAAAAPTPPAKRQAQAAMARSPAAVAVAARHPTTDSRLARGATAAMGGCG